MKAERRHELQTNSLALWIRWRLPEIWRKHGTKILLGLIAVAALAIVVQRMLAAPKAAFARAQDVLGQADQLLAGIRRGEIAHDADALKTIKEGQFPALVKKALDESDKPLIQARAFNLLGDYYYELAVRRISDSDATTRPMSDAISAKQLDQAASQYEKALSAKSDQPDLTAHAHIGLGTIAYTRAFNEETRVSDAKKPPDPTKWAANPQWKIAVDQFNAVINDAKSPEALKGNARDQLERARQLQENPVQILKPGESPAPEPEPPTPATSQPAQTPATTQPAGPAIPNVTTAPTTQIGTTKPAAATTRP